MVGTEKANSEYNKIIIINDENQLAHNHMNGMNE